MHGATQSDDVMASDRAGPTRHTAYAHLPHLSIRILLQLGRGNQGIEGLPRERTGESQRGGASGGCREASKAQCTHPHQEEQAGDNRIHGAPFPRQTAPLFSRPARFRCRAHSSPAWSKEKAPRAAERMLTVTTTSPRKRRSSALGRRQQPTPIPPQPRLRLPSPPRRNRRRPIKWRVFSETTAATATATSRHSQSTPLLRL